MATTKRMAHLRSQGGVLAQIHTDNNKTKRGLEPHSPGKMGQADKKKRTAFGDITNAHKDKQLQGKKGLLGKKTTSSKKKSEVVIPLLSSQPESNQAYDIVEFSQSSQESVPSSGGSGVDQLNQKNSQLSQEVRMEEQMEVVDWEDVDAEHMKDPHQVALYAAFIFDYYKEREVRFVVDDYLSRQKDLSVNMRAILVDWLVEVQENFELNHETLYLAVKLVDQYLARKLVKKDRLQLLGATCLFISCKFDERCPPVLDDFLYICDDAYNKDELLEMERQVLRAVDFYLGIPLSYRFLRRYAKCCKAAIETLTLGRFILETSLMHYEYCKYRESEMAAAALWLSMKMRNDGAWSPTLIHYTGYTEQSVLHLAQQFNIMISSPANKQLHTVRAKYSHQIFHEVAKISPLSLQEMSDLVAADLV